jgi:hypothetical protein
VKETNPIIYYFIFIMVLLVICSFGMYSDYKYKMKKLELVESGKLKTYWELYEKK